MANTGVITQLLESNFDAFSNLWDVEIDFPRAILETNENLQREITLRATSFTYTPFTVGEYQISYKGVTLTRPAPFANDTARTFSLTFRVDSDWAGYDYFMQWKHLVYDPSTDSQINYNFFSQSNRINDSYYGTVRLYTYKLTDNNLENIADVTSSSSYKKLLYSFTNVLVREVGFPTFDRAGSGSVITLPVSFIFGKVIELDK